MERVLLALVGALVGAPSFAQSSLSSDELRLARYTTAASGPTAAELDPLQSIVTINFPRREVATVAQALDYLLLRSGFRLSKTDQSEVEEILSLPLPEVHRRVGPYSVERALGVLMGEAFALAVDPVRRRVSYTLRHGASKVATVPSASPPQHKPTVTPVAAPEPWLRGAPMPPAQAGAATKGASHVRIVPVDVQ